MRQTPGTLETFLIVFGMKLKKFEQSRKQIAFDGTGRFQYEKKSVSQRLPSDVEEF